jgi:tRNA(fMet)-specific endonuclease VapC
MKYLLDTDTCIAALRQRQRVIQRLSQVSPSDCAVSMIAVFELWCGVEQAQQAAAEQAKVNRFISAILELLYDLLIARQTLAGGLILVTNNTREFQRVNGLRIENWW